jgi:hypothetical protein
MSVGISQFAQQLFEVVLVRVGVPMEAEEVN